MGRREVMDTKEERDFQEIGCFHDDPEIPSHSGSRGPAFAKRSLNLEFYL